MRAAVEGPICQVVSRHFVQTSWRCPPVTAEWRLTERSELLGEWSIPRAAPLMGVRLLTLSRARADNRGRSVKNGHGVGVEVTASDSYRSGSSLSSSYSDGSKVRLASPE